MSIEKRLVKLEKQRAPLERGVEHMKPSEILTRADELIQQGAVVTDQQRRAVEALRKMVTQ